jgi:hypothetical protein
MENVMPNSSTNQTATRLLVFACFLAFSCNWGLADGKVVPPRNYKGSLEERSQEAIIIFHSGSSERSAKQDMILKIQVEGDAKEFAWIVPFPSAPKVTKEDPKLFTEVFDYVQYRKHTSGKTDGAKSESPRASNDAARPDSKVKVISRQVVGEFDVVVVQEKAEGGLNPWLEKEGFQTLENADDVIGYYRDQGYVFACIKVNSKPLETQKSIESHPLRFTFETTGRDGVFFPMRMTSLQEKPFDVNLYVFYGAWLNDKLSKFGYKHRGFKLYFRDWDTSRCEPNAGKAWSSPEDDPYLGSVARRIPLLTKLFQKLHPGEKYYLTNIQAKNVDPKDVREWTSDLWMFPYYTNRDFIPYDAREGGPAAKAYPNVAVAAPVLKNGEKDGKTRQTAGAAGASASDYYLPKWSIVIPVAAIVGLLGFSMFRRTKTYDS